jgi:hypothetical protein
LRDGGGAPNRAAVRFDTACHFPVAPIGSGVCPVVVSPVSSSVTVVPLGCGTLAMNWTWVASVPEADVR